MALIGSNKGIVKNDINFFAAFTANARKQAQALAAVSVAALIIVGIAVGFLAVQFFTFLGLKSSVNTLKDTLAQPEYQQLDAEARELEAEVLAKTQYQYVISNMRQTVDAVAVASADLPGVIGDAIPNDAYVSTYEITGTEAQITGYTYNYYSALNMINRLQESDVFSSTDISIARMVPDTGSDDNIEGIPYVDSCYVFQVTGNLTTDIYITCTMFTDDGVTISALSSVQTQTIKPGETYSFDGVASFGDGAYTLSYVKVDGIVVSADELQSIMDSDSVSGRAQTSVSIECYYAPVAGEGSEA